MAFDMCLGKASGAASMLLDEYHNLPTTSDLADLQTAFSDLRDRPLVQTLSRCRCIKYHRAEIFVI